MSVTQDILTGLHQKGPRGVDAIEFAKATHSFPLSTVSIAFSLLGPAAAVVSDELASLDALMMARDWLLAGRCQRVIVVGYEHFSPLLQAHLGHLASEGHYCDNLSVVMLETQSSALAPGAGVTWTSGNHNDYYYGISVSESARSGLAQYQPGSSWTSYVEMSVNYRFNENWRAFFIARGIALSSEVRNSPMVSDDVSGMLMTGASYVF